MLNGSYEKPGKDVKPETDEANKLLLKYPVSGLYRNDGSPQLLWPLQYMSWRQGITLSSDGHHLVVWGEWASDNKTYSDRALSFYADGQLLTTYTVRDLVAYPEDLPHSVSHYQWLLESALDDTRGLLNIETCNHEKYAFSLNTGQPVSSDIPRIRYRNSERNDMAANSTVVPSLAGAGYEERASENRDFTIAMGMAFSVGSLTGVFAGVQILSGKARRRRSRSNSPYLSVPQPAALRLKSRARGSKVAPRRLGFNPHKWTL
jgi:hypothetical protein